MTFKGMDSEAVLALGKKDMIDTTRQRRSSFAPSGTILEDFYQQVTH